MSATITPSRGFEPRSWLGRAEDWLDSKGRGAWIAAMVLGFIVFWPIGLGLVAYITYTNRWSKSMSCQSRRNRHAMAHHAAATLRPSGNSAFDAYKAETLRRLEEEQEAFEAFLQRLRDAKDKSEFDAFMDDRARAARSGRTEDRADDMQAEPRRDATGQMPPAPGTSTAGYPGSGAY